MKMLTKTDRVILIILAVLAAACAAFFLRPGRAADAPAEAGAAVREVEYTDYNGRPVGILTGTNMEAETFKYFPDSEYMYLGNYANLNAALLSGQIDAYLADEPAMKSIHAQEPRVDYIKKRLTNNRYSFAFRKDDPKEKALCDQFNEFLAGLKADGTYDEIDATWFGTDDSRKVVDMSGLTGENGTIHVVTTSTDEPFSYIKDGQHVGYDIDVVVRFCRACGYALELGDVDYPARIPAIASGRYEFTTTMNVTPEREESVLFSDPVSEGGIVVAVRTEDLANAPSLPSFSDYAGKTIGSAVGTTYDRSIAANIPDAQISYFNSYVDMLAALEAGVIDGFCADEPVVRYMMTGSSAVTYLPRKLEEYGFAFAFAKNAHGRALCDEFSAFVGQCRSDGTLAELDEIWFGTDESRRKAPDLAALDGRNGALDMALEADNPPFVYMVGTDIAGYEVDLAYRFCLANGYSLSLTNYTFDAILPAVQSGVSDFGGSGMTPTEERAESVYFSEPHYDGGPVLAVRTADVAPANAGSASSPETAGKGFLAALRESFERNFIRESRWKLILRGTGVTCLITLLSTLFGTALAFLICLFRRLDSVLAVKISDLYVKIMQGTPMVVLLMILFYIVFARTGVKAITVAVIGFTLNFAAYASEIMRSGIEGIDKGQREAALALGFTENQAFFRYIFPQAAVHFLPVYRGEIVSLLKTTSIVGYISIQDLTKMSDIIRSRTYEAFFPLIATALIYFALAWIISLLMNRLLSAMRGTGVGSPFQG